MALIHIGFFSEALGMCVNCDVVLPQTASGQIGMAAQARDGRHPTLWLLHGASDDHTVWQRRTSIERYAARAGPRPWSCPAVHLSFLRQHGARRHVFDDYIADELPTNMRALLPADRPARGQLHQPGRPWAARARLTHRSSRGPEHYCRHRLPHRQRGQFPHAAIWTVPRRRAANRVDLRRPRPSRAPRRTRCGNARRTRCPSGRPAPRIYPRRAAATTSCWRTPGRPGTFSSPSRAIPSITPMSKRRARTPGNSGTSTFRISWRSTGLYASGEHPKLIRRS